MERKTKHRILGIIVIAAIVVATLPLFHSNSSEIKVDPKLVSAPPFPEQAVQTSDNPEFKVALANQEASIPFKKNQENDSGINQLPDDTINPNNSQTYIDKQAAPRESLQTVDDNDSAAVLGGAKEPANHPTVLQSSKEEATPSTQDVFRNSLESELQAEVKPNAKKAQHRVKLYRANVKSKQAKIDNDGLFKLKSSAWVIQLGSYRNKSQALKLVNRLRASGYNAFIQEASVGTHVYVGPEVKEVIARSIASRLAYEMNIQGLVISYKPLTL